MQSVIADMLTCISSIGGSVGNRVRLNVMNLNKQTKLFSQGMQPVVQCVSSIRPPRLERIKEKCSYRVGRLGTLDEKPFEKGIIHYTCVLNMV